VVEFGLDGDCGGSDGVRWGWGWFPDADPGVPEAEQVGPGVDAFC
jgi:hypothetical protein